MPPPPRVRARARPASPPPDADAPFAVPCHPKGMLVREQPATDLTIATRILARAGALAPDGRITLRLRDVLYICGRGVSLATMTPYDVAVIFLADGSTLHGDPPDDVAAYVDAHARWPDAASVARAPDGTYVSAPAL